MSIGNSIGESIGFSIGSSIGEDLAAIFQSDLQDTLVPQRAFGSPIPTFTRATTATVEDFEGLVKTVLSGEARFKGARRVENLLSFSEDLTGAAWSVATAGNGSVPAQVSGNTFTFATGGTGAGDHSDLRQNDYMSNGVGKKLVARYLISASASVDMSIFTETGVVAETISLTTTPRIITTNVTGMSSTPDLMFRLAGNIAGDITVDITIEKIQVQDKSGVSDPTIPDDYVSTDVLSAPFHGANVDGVQYFKTKNGNTVASNVVTEATGALIGASDSHADASGPFGRLREVARINIAIQSSVFENVAWTKSNITATDNDAVSPAGTMTAGLLLGTAANGTAIQDLGVISSAEHRGGLWIKRKTGTGNIDLTINNGSTWTTAAVTTTWTRFFSAAVTAANPDIGIRIVTDTDAVWVWNGQAEAAPFLTSDIETVASAVTRNADVLTYVSAGNILNATGTFTSDATSIWATADAQSTLFDTGSMTVYTGAGLAATTMKAEDGTNTVALTGGATMENSPQTIAVTWGATLDVYSEAVNATGSFDGSMNIATNFGLGCTDAGTLQSSGTERFVKIFGTEFSAGQVAAL